MKYNLRKINPRRVYTTRQIAELFRIRFQSVQEWIYYQNLKPLNPGSSPLYFSGEDLYNFLLLRKNKRRCTLRDDEFYCCACGKPRKSKPSDLAFIYTKIQIGKSGRFKLIRKGKCEACGSILNRFATYEKRGEYLDCMPPISSP